MYPDFEELLQCLNDEKAEYLIVGGYAVAHHAQQRATKDLDIFVGTAPENAECVWNALVRFGAALDDLPVEEFKDPNTAFRMGVPPVMVEIIRMIDGVDFAAAYARRTVEIINPEKGIEAAYISADDLLHNKLTAGRLQDLADAEALRAARAGRSGDDEGGRSG